MVKYIKILYKDIVIIKFIIYVYFKIKNIYYSMNKIIISFIFTFLAGLSTLLGTIFIFFKKDKNKNILISSLAFASSVMLTVSICDLIPESISLLKSNNQGIIVIIISFISMIVGIIISMLIDKYLPSNNNDNLYKVGIISMVAIILHNIPEDCSCYVSR